MKKAKEQRINSAEQEHRGEVDAPRELRERKGRRKRREEQRRKTII